MSEPGIRVELAPQGKVLRLGAAQSLRDLLFAQGVEFPCGGRGRCKGCRIRVLSGRRAPTRAEAAVLSLSEREEGWRLACQISAEADLVLELAQWEVPILADGSAFEFQPEEGFGAAIDVGTTTLVAQLLDLNTSRVLAVRSDLNDQAQFGADIMSRLEMALDDAGRDRLTRLIRRQIHELIAGLFLDSGADPRRLKKINLVGNTVMHHLFCGTDVRPLAAYPFHPADAGWKIFQPADLGWNDWKAPLTISFLPCLGGFVGSDLLAGILAARLHQSERPRALIDLGTNGEIILGNRHRLLCASTAAGPAFEGARISIGMRAAAGAISSAQCGPGRIECRVLGGGAARGVCGSGLVDAVAAGLDLGLVHPSGRLPAGRLHLTDGLALTQSDIRELQLAKGAIAAGLCILARRWGVALENLDAIYLAGAFGNYLSRSGARRIGLLPLPAEKIQCAGNTALLGAKIALYRSGQSDGVSSALQKIEHVPLGQDLEFHETFAQEMRFPERLP